MTDMVQSRLWFPFSEGAAGARARMFCLPFAGGGASNFAAWHKLLPEVGIAPVTCPIIAYAGAQDATASVTAMKEWRHFTTGTFRLREFDGGHFFLRTAPGFEAALKVDMSAMLSAYHKRLASA